MLLVVFDSLATHGIHPESSNSVIEDPYNCNSSEVEKDDKYNEYNASVPPLHLEEENLESSDGSEGESRDEHLSDEGVQQWVHLNTIRVLYLIPYYYIYIHTCN